jgi:uncharacterized protein YutE (UPF0331/DUF86 family)
MSAPELRAYLTELQAQAENYVLELDALERESRAEGLSNRDFFAAERLLQVLIEAAIGVAKHWVKELHRATPVDAYQSFELLSGLEKLDAGELTRWKKIVGMRNALVHDYLNVDRQLILAVLQQRAYVFVLDFIRKAAAGMNAETP